MTGGLFRKASVRRPDIIPVAIPFSDKLDGWLDFRQVKGGITKWKKIYASVIDLKLYLFDKEQKDKTKAFANFDIK